MKILVTGAAGFIGFHTVRRLLERGDEVVGLDNINDYYDVNLKYGRLTETGINRESVDWYKFTQSDRYPHYRFIRMNLEDMQAMRMLFANEGFNKVINLAAQAGVRYSITNPQTYVGSNLDGFLNILEGCRHHHISHLVYASSSSVYGLNGKVPFSEHDSIAHPVSLYAATKKSNELTTAICMVFPRQGFAFSQSMVRGVVPICHLSFLRTQSWLIALSRCSTMVTCYVTLPM